jgi:diguanylate cyclase (GGDEF)-like protein/PAS domain S-box-containing protein
VVIYIAGGSIDITPYIVALIIAGGLLTASWIAYFFYTHKLRLKLEESEARYHQLRAQQDAIFHSASGVSIIASDMKGNITLFNKGAELLLGYRAEEVIGMMNPLAFHDDDELAQRMEQLAQGASQPITWTNVFFEYAKGSKKGGQEWTYIRQDGTAITVNLFVTRIEVDGIVIGYMGIATDLTERKETEEALREANGILQELSFKDGLTGISNRRHFDESLEREWSRARRYSSPLSLILFDIDYFKRYNDFYGHQAGDECLRVVTTMLKAMIQRKTDIYARYGGEEFALILPDTELDRATGIAELVRLAIEACNIPNVQSKVSQVITISAGVASVNLETMSNFSDLIAAADSSLYIAKQEGRNRVISFDQESNNRK